MDSFTDSEGLALSHVPLVLTPESPSSASVSSSVFRAGVPCEAGRYLAASGGSSSLVEARRTGSGDPFVDLSTTPIPLSPFAGEVVEFDFRVTAAAERVSELLTVRTTFQP